MAPSFLLNLDSILPASYIAKGLRVIFSFIFLSLYALNLKECNVDVNFKKIGVSMICSRYLINPIFLFPCGDFTAGVFLDFPH